MFNEPDEPSMFDEIQTVVFASPEKVGKVFRVLDDKLRLCLICEGVFTRQGAAGHANVACYPRTRESEDDEGMVPSATDAEFLPILVRAYGYRSNL